MFKAEDIVQMAKDAARYRWLRENASRDQAGHLARCYTPEEWDERIDKMMKEQE